VLLGQASVSATLTGLTTGGRGFFDPGAGFTRPQVSVGCGVTVTGVTVDSPSQASLTLDTTAATDTGPCNVTFTNPDGQTASASVLGFEHAPVAVDDSFSAVQDSVLHGSSVLANDSDPDGDSLTASKASNPAHGTVSVNVDGTFTYTPAAGYSGPDSFTYAVSDGTLQDTGTVSISVTTDHAPVAVDDAYVVAQDTVLHGSSVLANDTDADSDPLTAAKATDPAHGTVTVNPDGTFTYTPSAGYSGPDFFTYTVSDGALQDTGMVSIAVTPSLPVIQPPPLPGPPAPVTPPPASVTKLTLHAKKLKGRPLRVRISGAGPTGARVRVVVLRGKKRTARKTVTVVTSRWKVTISLKRHGRYRIKATAGSQHAAITKRL
jgi:VCBS repeat-containing protein